MNTEYEVRILEIDKDSFIKKLEKLGAEKVGDFFRNVMFMILILLLKESGLDLGLMVMKALLLLKILLVL